MAPPVSPEAAEKDIPVSSATTSAMEAACALIFLAMAYKISPRSTGVIAAHPGWALLALSTARSTSADLDRAALVISLPLAGASFWMVSPEAAGRCRPPIQLGMN
jgi:hypothetical protein